MRDALSASSWHTVDPNGAHDAVVPVGDPSPGSQPAHPHTVVLNAVYSPDGSRALFLNDNGCEYLADADGTGALGLTPGPTRPYSADCHELSSWIQAPVLPTPINAGDWAWSADSENVYFVDASGAVGTVSADGTKVTRTGATVPAGYRLLSVSPSGALAFKDNQTPSHIAILDPGAAAPRVLTSGEDAKFSAGTGRLMVRDQTIPPGGAFGISTLFTVDPASGARTQVSDPATEEVASFAWSPDGTQVAYAATPAPSGSTNATIYTRPIGGGARTTVVQNAGYPTVTSWHNGPLTPPRAADRIGGADRIETAVDASRWSYGKTGTGGRQASVAVISRSDQFADALGGSALAAQKGGPLLLTATDGLDSRVGDELVRVLKPGSKVYVLGGTSALSPAVEAQIKRLGFVTERLAGNDRFETSVAVAHAVSPNPHTVMVATGVKFPDALAAGAAAAQDPNGGVVVLSNEGTLPAPVKGYLSGVNPGATDVYGVGGQGVAALRTGFPQWAGKVTPLSGADRFATAAAIASSKLFTSHGPVGRIGLATGMSWPDALSGGALIATQHGPLLLTDPGSQYLPKPELDLVRALAPHLSGVVVFGGYQAVGTVASNTAESALGHNHYYSYLNRQEPELAGPR
ncbi:cell wall-binding repeat-containing protein [Catenulispora subtropica]|uniref:cell wall-binding repeat-containing protein n=1 Tax=Catenulispora subtropica TaxID=450798 RepID=UPI0031DB39E2